ncbi:MAG: hypothetical protein JWM68_2259, partial [Verrucomicrobiales bacterium]|nr:hypothetical protein [Verrucomicrobiales bacterium]
MVDRIELDSCCTARGCYSRQKLLILLHLNRRTWRAILLAGKRKATLPVFPLVMGKLQKLSLSFHLFVLLFWSSISGEARPVTAPCTGEPAGQLRTSDIMRSAKVADEEKKEKNNIKFEFDFEFEMPEREDNVNLPISGSNPNIPVVASSPQSAAISFTGATLADTLAYPPDTMGTVGPAQFIVAVNGRIRTFDKNTGLADGVINADTDVFFNSVMTPPASNNFTSDPRIRYDRLSQRWFIIIIDVPGKAGVLPNRVMLAVSDGPVVTAGTVWHYFFFQHDLVTPTSRTDTGNFADYPTLGIDANALYIGVNVFNTGGAGSFANTTAFVIRKSSVLGAGPIVVKAFRNLIPNHGGGAYTPQGVDNFDPNATEGYLIGVDSDVYGALQLIRVINPGGTPSISTASISLPVINGATMNVPHLGNTGGTAGNVDGLDYRLLAAHIRNGKLWTTANLAVDNTGSPSGTDTRMGVRWYQLQNLATGQTPSVAQSGTVFQPSASNTTDQRSYWMGSVMVSGQGHAAMGFSVAGVNERINAGYCGRLATDPAGTMQTPALYTSTTSAYNPVDSASAPINRWGDYSYTSLDPTDDMTMWTIQEFCNAANSYGVQVIKLLAPLPATASSCNPSIVVQGSTNVSVVVTGTVVSGSGFFDPGAGFSNRIAAAVNGGGVTVNTITYTDPTHITLNLSVSPSATTSARTITVTNPDGQAVTSGTALLTITTSSNQAPVLAAISNTTINEATNFTFTALASDADAGQILTFSLDAGAPAGASINASNGVFTWTPSEAQGPGSNSITVRVTDNGVPALNDAKTFSVTVNEVNVAPALAGISNRSVNEGSTLTVTNAVTDSDVPANAITFSLGTNAPAGASVNPTTGVFTWTPTEAQGPGAYPITVIATDNGSPVLSDTKTFSVTVNETNSAPVLTAISDVSVNEGITLTVTNVATDSDVPANAITFSLGTNAPAGASVNPTTGIFTWTPTEAQGPGAYPITVIATDNGSPVLSDAKTFSVTVNETNSAPILAAISDVSVNEGITLTVTNVATDSDVPANTITFSLGTNAPAGASVNPTTGIFTWTPTEAQGPGAYPITVIATDSGSPVLSDTKTFSVTVNETNSAPILAAISDVSVNEGITLTVTNVATDSDVPANTITFSLGTNAPAGASVNPTTGIFTWTLTEAQGPGVYSITVVATDNGSPVLSDTKTFSVTVNETNSAPILAAISDVSMNEGSALTVTNVATDSDVPANAITFSLGTNAPVGASVNPTTGIFTWTPTEAQGPGAYPITVIATDNGSPVLSDTKTFSVTVN